MSTLHRQHPKTISGEGPKEMIQYTRVTAEGKIHNVPEHVYCQTCAGTAYRDSDPELDSYTENEYIVFYQCENHHYTKAVVELRT